MEPTWFSFGYPPRDQLATIGLLLNDQSLAGSIELEPTSNVLRGSEYFVDVVGLVLAALLLIALGWAAIERGRVHREWARLRTRGEERVQAIDWCVAMAAAGCL